MRRLSKIAVAGAFLALGFTLPVTAQIVSGTPMNFTTSFPFYAGNAKMPAGSYRITASDFDDNELQIQSLDKKYSAFVDFIPTQSEQPHKQSDVTFHKYGNTEYLNRIWIQGQQFGMKVYPTKAELKSTSLMVEHSIAGN